MDPFIGEIRAVGFEFAPRGWATCDGQVLPIAQNPALYAVLGTVYGGDGVQTFALPDLAGRAPMHPGTGPGLTPRRLAEGGGSERVALEADHLPPHIHEVACTSSRADQAEEPSPQHVWADTGGRSSRDSYSPATPDRAMRAGALTLAGGERDHNNLQPCLALNFVIALEGIFPPRP